MYTDINLTTNSALRITKIPLVASFFPKKNVYLQDTENKREFRFSFFLSFIQNGYPVD